MRGFSTLASAAVFGLLLTPHAEAGARSWVSSTGTDSGTCLVAVPCRTFQYALDHTDAGGEIDVKDPGGYGPLRISKPIAVIADGVLATVGGQTNTYAVSVFDMQASDVVLLRGLTVNGTDSDAGGGFYVGSGKVTIDHCSAKGLSYGVFVDASSNGVAITNNIFTGNNIGIFSSSFTFVGIGGNIIVNNRTGIFTIGSATYTYGDNKINSNSSRDILGTLIQNNMQ